MADLSRAAAPCEVPCLALRGAVVLPGTTVPLLVGRQKSVRAVRAAAPRGRLLLLAQREEETGDPAPSDLHDVGVLARIRSASERADGMLRVVVEAGDRARAVSWPRTTPLLVACAETVREVADADETLCRGLIERYRQLGRRQGDLPHDAGKLCDLVADELLDRPQDRQGILEAIRVRERIERLHRLLIRQAEKREVERFVDIQVRRRLERAQREFYLQEQMNAIREELGERSEADELRARLGGRTLPERVSERVEHELQRLERMQPLSAEAAVTRSYLDWLLALPWDERTADRPDPRAAREVLDADHDGLEDVKRRILEHLAMRRLVDRFEGPILCLVGPPGTGKTSIARSVAAALGRRLARVSLGGVHDEAEIRGHRRAYIGALPGRIIRGMRHAGALNPVFLLDEIDKLGADRQGDPASALLEVLDPGQNARFSDHYLEIPFDLSEVLFITTANSLQHLPRPLLDRLEVVRVSGYSEEEKLRIARRHLLPRQIAAHGLAPADLRVSPAALRDIVRDYTREAGVRSLDRQLAAICRQAVRRRADGGGPSVAVTHGNLARLLGEPRRFDSGLEHRPPVGAAVGLCWSETGGEVLIVEVAAMAGRGRLSLTGRLGEVMRESAETAFSHVRANARALGVCEGFHEHLDVHLHVPGGAVPKDGPSAGVTIAAALVSALSERRLRPDVALTGEVTLLGRILPVGGVREKVLAARRAGLRTVVLPAGNRVDWDELPSPVRSALRPVFVTDLAQALEAVLDLPQPAVFV